MIDGSTYSGVFADKTLKEGAYTHFTGFIFKGQFNRERFYKGSIEFIDGDILKGEWGLKRGRWILKKGEMFNDEGKILYSFDGSI